MSLPLLKKCQRANDRAAMHYDAHAQLPRVINESLLERLDFLENKPKTILEIGSGTAYLQSKLKNKFPSAFTIGLDLSFAMLVKNKMTAVQADMHHLPFPSHCFDLICSVLTLEWSSNVFSLFKEIKRVLKPEGLFIFATLGPDTLHELRQVSESTNCFYDMHDMGDMLMQLQFKDPVIDREDFTLLYPSISVLLKELKWLGSIKTLPRIHRGLKKKNFLKNLETNYRKDNQHFPATFEVVYGHALGTYEREENVTRIPVSQITRLRK